MKTEEVSSQNSNKLILRVVGVLIAILVLSSIIYELKKSGNRERITSRNSGLLDGHISAIAIDSSDRVWFGTKGGVSVFDGENWETYTTQDSGLINDLVNAIAIDSSDRVWVGTQYDGVSVYDGENWVTYKMQDSGLLDDRVSAIAIDSSDRVWVGTLYLGVSVFDGENWESYTTQNSGLGGDYIRAIAIDSSDRVWFGTGPEYGKPPNPGDISLGRGVSSYNGENWESYTTQDPGLVDGSVSAIAIDSSERVWVGAEGGVSVFDGENWESYTTQNSGLADENVHSIAIDSSDRVWSGTNHAFSVFEGENWVTYTEDNSGILSEWGQIIVSDKRGYMWVGTIEGVDRIPIGERLLVSPFLASIRDLFFSPRLSLWLNLALVIILANVAFILSDRKKSVDEQEPTEENNVLKRSPALQGALGGVTAGVIALLLVIGNPIPAAPGSFIDLTGGFLILLAVLAIPVSLVLVGPLAGMVGVRVFKSKKGAYLSGLLAQLFSEVSLIWLLFYR